jgi:hypothetical protein
MEYRGLVRVCITRGKAFSLNAWAVEWVDIGTEARVPLKFFVYLKKRRGKWLKNLFDQVTPSLLVCVILYSTPYKGGNFF